MRRWDKNFLFEVEYDLFNKFNNVINLIYKDKIYSILNENLKDSPYSMILPCSEFEFLLKSDKKKYVFNKSEGVEYNCEIKVNSETISLKNLNHLEKRLKSIIVNNNPFEDYFHKMRKEKHFNKLIGLGIGLTPSGDDYLVGTVATYLSKGLKVPTTLVEIILKGKQKTNKLSYNFLLNALEGLFIKDINDFFVNKNSSNFDIYVNNILKIGSTSGRDILYGIYDTLVSLETK